MPNMTYKGKRAAVDVVLPDRNITVAYGETVEVTAAEAKNLGTVPGFEKTPAKRAAKKGSN